MPPQRTFGEIPLLAPVQPVFPTVPTGPWESGPEAQTNASGVGSPPPTGVAPVALTVSVSAAVTFESPTPTQTPVQASAQAAATPDAPTPTFSKAQSSVPVLPVLPSPTHAAAEADALSPVSKTKFLAQSSAAPAPGPAQTAPAEAASLSTSQPNVKTTSASIHLKPDPCAEVGQKTPNGTSNFPGGLLHVFPVFRMCFRTNRCLCPVTPTTGGYYLFSTFVSQC